MNDGHGTYSVIATQQTAVAACACGWRSTPYPNSGMAGAAWDAHARGRVVDRDLALQPEATAR